MRLTFAHDFVTWDLRVSQSPPPIEWFERISENDNLKMDSALNMMLNETNSHVPEEVYDFWVEGWNINQGSYVEKRECSLAVTVHIPSEIEWIDVEKLCVMKREIAGREEWWWGCWVCTEIFLSPRKNEYHVFITAWWILKSWKLNAVSSSSSETCVDDHRRRHCHLLLIPS